MNASQSGLKVSQFYALETLSHGLHSVRLGMLLTLPILTRDHEGDSVTLDNNLYLYSCIHLLSVYSFLLTTPKKKKNLDPEASG